MLFVDRKPRSSTERRRSAWRPSVLGLEGRCLLAGFSIDLANVAAALPTTAPPFLTGPVAMPFPPTLATINIPFTPKTPHFPILVTNTTPRLDIFIRESRPFSFSFRFRQSIGHFLFSLRRAGGCRCCSGS